MKVRIMTTAINEKTPDQEISAYGPARSTITGEPLSPEELGKIDAYWRASLYLSIGMLCWAIGARTPASPSPTSTSTV